MIGLPFESREMIYETIRFNIELKSVDPTFNIFYPFPGTKLRELCIKENLFDKDYELNRSNKMLFYESPLINTLVPANEIKRIQSTAFLYLNIPGLLYPLIDLCGNDEDPFSSRLTKELREIAYRSKYDNIE